MIRLLGRLAFVVTLAFARAGADGVDPASGAGDRAAEAGGEVEEEFERLLSEERRIRERPENLAAVEVLDGMLQAYGRFVERFPEHARGRLQYAGWLLEAGRAGEARPHVMQVMNERANDPQVYYLLAGLHLEAGEIREAFRACEKAVALKPETGRIHSEYAGLVAAFRRDAAAHFGLTEPQVFDKALELYEEAMRIEPGNFRVAKEIAMTHYLIRDDGPGAAMLLPDAAIAAWERAWKLAPGDRERQDIAIHLARIKIMVNRFDEARAHLAEVQLNDLIPLMERVKKNLEQREQAALEAVEGLVL